jgi:LysR family glycine cleavage system transcriptional activator
MAIRPPSLRQVVAFEAAARHGSFRDAARELNLSDSAVSHAVRTLEERLGRPLFLRRKGRVQLTDEGRSLCGRVVAGLSLLSDAFDTQVRAGRTRLAVSALPAFAQRVLIPRLPAFLARNEDLQFDLRATDQLADVAEGEADLGIRYGSGRWAGVQAELLAPAPLIAVAAPAYVQARRIRSLADLADCELLNERQGAWRRVPMSAQSSLQSAGAAQACLTLEDLPCAIEAATAGLGVALAPALLVAAELRSQRLVRAVEAEAPSDAAFWLVWSNASAKLDLIQRFGAWLKGVVAEAAPADDLRLGRPVAA